MAGAVFTFFLGLVPATHLSVAGTVVYVGVMAVGMTINLGTPFLLHRARPSGSTPQADPNLAWPAVAGKQATRGTALV